MTSMRFEGQTALVTGASSGIGRACARALAAEGATVALISRRSDALDDVRAEIESAGGEALVLASDLRQAAARDAMMDAALDALGGLDVLVNAAGVIGYGSVRDTALGDWADMMELNVTAPFHLMQRAVPALERRPGAVVNVSSVTGTRSFPGLLAYCTSKAAVDQLTRCAALELAESGVRVNAVNPGVVVTNLHKAGGLDEQRYAGFLEHSKDTHPLGRVGTPDEVAALVLFLASADSGWITGVTLPIDGGRHLTCAR